MPPSRKSQATNVLAALRKSGSSASSSQATQQATQTQATQSNSLPARHVLMLPYPDSRMLFNRIRLVDEDNCKSYDNNILGPMTTIFRSYKVHVIKPGDRVDICEDNGKLTGPDNTNYAPLLGSVKFESQYDICSQSALAQELEGGHLTDAVNTLYSTTFVSADDLRKSWIEAKKSSGKHAEDSNRRRVVAWSFSDPILNNTNTLRLIVPKTSGSLTKYFVTDAKARNWFSVDDDAWDDLCLSKDAIIYVRVSPSFYTLMKDKLHPTGSLTSDADIVMTEKVSSGSGSAQTDLANTKSMSAEDLDEANKLFDDILGVSSQSTTVPETVTAEPDSIEQVPSSPDIESTVNEGAGEPDSIEKAPSSPEIESTVNEVAANNASAIAEVHGQSEGADNKLTSLDETNDSDMQLDDSTSPGVDTATKASISDKAGTSPVKKQRLNPDGPDAESETQPADISDSSHIQSPLADTAMESSLLTQQSDLALKVESGDLDAGNNAGEGLAPDSCSSAAKREPPETPKQKQELTKHDSVISLSDTEGDEQPPPSPLPSWGSLRRHRRAVQRKTGQNMCYNGSDSFEWPLDAIDTLLHAEGVAKLHDVHSKLDSMSISTAYSGIGAPETAVNQLSISLALALQPKPIPKVKFYGGIEWTTECQNELKILYEAHDACLWGDIASFYTPDVQRVLPACHENPDTIMEVLAPSIRTGRAVKRSAWCITHNKDCCIKTARMHIAGTSCTAHSTQGQQKKEKDSNTIFLLAWIGLRLLLQEAIVIQENVTGFPVGFLSDFLSNLYFIDSMPLNSLDFGWAATRTRQYVVMRHKLKVVSMLSPLNQEIRKYYRPLCHTWRAYFYLHEFEKVAQNWENTVIADELQAELSWSQKRPGSRAYFMEPLEINTPEAFKDSLTETEHAYTVEYAQIKPLCAWQLNQDPTCHGMASTYDYLHCLIHNMHLIFSEEFSRWLCGSEALTAMAFPVHPVWQAHVLEFGKSMGCHPVCSFNIMRPDRKPRAICGQAGNSMNVKVIGAVILYCLCNFEFIDEIDFIRTVRSLKRRLSTTP